MTSTKSTALAVTCAAVAATLLGGCGTSTSSSAGGTTTATATTTTTTTTTAAAMSAVTSPTSGVTGGEGSTGESGASGTGATSATGVPRCHTGDLSGHFTAVQGSQGAGNIVYNIDLTNTSSHPCTVYGYPGMLLLNAAHAALPTNVQRSTIAAKTYVTLIPNGDASASARFSPDVPGPGESASGCEPTAAYTEITPPDETTQLVVPVSPPTPVCEHGAMQVSAFVRGATGPGES